MEYIQWAKYISKEIHTYLFKKTLEYLNIKVTFAVLNLNRL